MNTFKVDLKQCENRNNSAKFSIQHNYIVIKRV